MSKWATALANLRRSRVHVLGALVAAGAAFAADPAPARRLLFNNSNGDTKTKDINDEATPDSGTAAAAGESNWPRASPLSVQDRLRLQRILLRVGFSPAEASRIEGLKLLGTTSSTGTGKRSDRVSDRVSGRVDRVLLAKESVAGSRWRGGLMLLPQYLLTDDPSAVLPSRSEQRRRLRQLSLEQERSQKLNNQLRQEQQHHLEPQQPQHTRPPAATPAGSAVPPGALPSAAASPMSAVLPVEKTVAEAVKPDQVAVVPWMPAEGWETGVATIADAERRAAWMASRKQMILTPEEQEYCLATLATHLYLNTSVTSFMHLGAGVAAGGGIVAGLSMMNESRFVQWLVRTRVMRIIPLASLWVALFWSTSVLQRRVIRHVDSVLEPGSLDDGILHAYLEQEFNRRVKRPLSWWRKLTITSTGIDLLDGPPFSRLAALERLRSHREFAERVRAKKLTNSQPAIDAAVHRIFSPELVDRVKHRYPKIRDRITFRWRQTLHQLMPLGGGSFGNRVTIYSGGDDAFEDMWRHMEAAQDRVWMETYIFDPDVIGKKTLDILTDASKRVDVRLIYDYVGSQHLGAADILPLVSAGADVVAFNPIVQWPPWSLKRFGFYRDHRKILLCDDVAFTGGRNVGVEYAGKGVGGTDWFRDAHIKVEGPAVRNLEDVYLNSLAETEHGRELPAVYHPQHPGELTRRAAEIPGRYSGSATVHDDVWVQVLQSNVFRSKRHLQHAMRVVLSEATDKCLIVTPYFLPPGRMKRAISAAAMRGVDVRIITSSDSCDAPLLRKAGRHVYRTLLRQGVKIFEYSGTAEHPQNIHSKVVTIDGIYTAIGSYNLDPLSDRHNLELSVCMLDPSVAQTLEKQFEADLHKCKEIQLEDLEDEGFASLALNWALYQMFSLLNIKSR